MSTQNRGEWLEYVLPKGRPFLLHYLRSVHGGSVFAVYHTESLLTFALLGTLASAATLGFGSVLMWIGMASIAATTACLAWSAVRQGHTTYSRGVYTYQRVLSGRAYIRGDQRVGPYDTVIDLHTGLSQLKGRFFERLAIEKAHTKTLAEAAQRTYEALLREDLTLMADEMLGRGVLRESDIVRCRLYMHPRYIPWLDGYEVKRFELREGNGLNSGLNSTWLARALARFIQLCAAGLRLSQLRRNLMFKPSKLFKVFPTRTYLILPEEREGFLRGCVARGDLSAEFLETHLPGNFGAPLTHQPNAMTDAMSPAVANH
jgi:hypothetical protein